MPINHRFRRLTTRCTRGNNCDALRRLLASRRTFAAKLLDAVKAGDIPRADVTPAYARQITGLNDKTLTQQLAAVWGELHDTPAEIVSTVDSPLSLMPEGLLEGLGDGAARDLLAFLMDKNPSAK